MSVSETPNAVATSIGTTELNDRNRSGTKLLTRKTTGMTRVSPRFETLIALVTVYASKGHIWKLSGCVGIVGRVVAAMAVGGGSKDGRHKDHREQEGSTESDSGRRYITSQA
ncbi:hypothetical protein Dimus_005055 [Dionaea muscipula]